MNFSEGMQLAMVIISGGGLCVSILNRRAIAVIHETTNGLSSRNEAIAQKLGVAEGKAEGLQQGRDENHSR